MSLSWLPISWILCASVPAAASVRPALLRSAPERPELSGPEEQIDRGRFRIRFTREGRDAPPPTDADANGLPDVVDTLAAALPEAEDAYLAEGWRPLAGDGGAGGSDAIDVYVRELDVYGYSTPVPLPDGSWSCMLEIDRGVTVAGSVAASVATHELHHCVEFRYTVQTASWLYEAAATYEQYSHVVDPLLDLAVGVLYADRLGHPQRKIDDTDGRFEYAGFLWMKYWSERGGFAPERLPELWEALAADPDWTVALDAESRSRFGTDLASTFLDHAVWNGFACANDVGGHYLADPIPCRAALSVPLTAWAGDQIDLVHDEGPFTAAYLSLPTEDDHATITCDGGEGLGLVGTSLDPSGARRAILPAAETDGGLRLDIPTAPGGELRLALAGTEDPLEATCVALPALRAPVGGCAVPAGQGRGGVWCAALALLALRRVRQNTAS